MLLCFDANVASLERVRKAIAIDDRNADEIHEFFSSFLSVLNYEED